MNTRHSHIFVVLITFLLAACGEESTPDDVEEPADFLDIPSEPPADVPEDVPADPTEAPPNESCDVDVSEICIPPAEVKLGECRNVCVLDGSCDAALCDVFCQQDYFVDASMCAEELGCVQPDREECLLDCTNDAVACYSAPGAECNGPDGILCRSALAQCYIECRAD